MPIYLSGVDKFVSDQRDYLYTPVDTKLPSFIDWSWGVDDIENQGSWGSCTANAVTGACELILSVNFQPLHLSRFFNYFNSRTHIGIPLEDTGDGGTYQSGSSTRESISSAHKQGLPDERIWKYTDEHDNEIPPETVYEDALTRKID